MLSDVSVVLYHHSATGKSQPRRAGGRGASRGRGGGRGGGDNRSSKGPQRNGGKTRSRRGGGGKGGRPDAAERARAAKIAAEKKKRAAELAKAEAEAAAKAKAEAAAKAEEERIRLEKEEQERQAAAEILQKQIAVSSRKLVGLPLAFLSFFLSLHFLFWFGCRDFSAADPPCSTLPGPSTG